MQLYYQNLFFVQFQAKCELSKYSLKTHKKQAQKYLQNEKTKPLI